MRRTRLLSLTAGTLLLGACAGAPPPRATVAPHADTSYGAGGYVSDDLGSLEAAYKRNPTDDNAAVRYAAGLENAGRTRRAIMVLTPFVDNGAASGNAPLLTRYAAAQAAIGDNNAAADAAREALAADPDDGEASYILGRTLEVAGDHLNAEVAFRQALAHWQGNQAPVLNDLGLNLASQGLLDESIATLQQAAQLSPDQPDYQRNLRIVQALKSQPGTHGTKLVPPPPPKPAGG